MPTICDERCKNATGGSCRCECRGENHGLLASGGGGITALEPSDRSGRPDPATLTGLKINRELEELTKADSTFGDAMIAAGRGNETPSVYLARGRAYAGTTEDKLAQEGFSINERQTALRREIERRAGPGVYRLPLSSTTDKRLFGPARITEADKEAQRQGYSSARAYKRANSPPT